MPDYALMNQCLYEGKAKEVEQMTRDALAEGRTVQEVLTEGLIAGMSVVGEDFKYNVLYVPEVLIAEGAGFQVHDIGVDKSIEKFLAATELYKPDIIGMSALLTTTMTYMKTVIDGYKQR